MKKIVVIQILFSFIFCSCSKDDFEDPNQTDKKLKSFTAYMIPLKYGLPSESSKFKWESKEYDKDGNLLLWEYRSNKDFDTENNWLNSEENTYENRTLKEKIEDNLISRHRHVYTYSNGKLSNEDVYDEDGLLEKFKYEYKGNETQPYKMSYWWYFFDKTPTTHNYSYDSNGNMIKDSINYSSVPYAILFWKYDFHNNMIEESYYSSETKRTVVQAIRKYKYDSTGKIQEYVFSSWYTIYFQKYMYQYSDNGTVSQIDAYESTNGQDGIFEQKGVIKYEYNYY